MSDFTNNFWATFITVITVVGVVACLCLLVINLKTKVPAQVTDNTTGHVWDEDLREMNNPLPRWWVGLFLLTIAFSVFYFFGYPGLGSYPGKLGWTQVGQYEQEVKKMDEKIAPLYAQFLSKPVEDVAKDPKAQAIGERLFMNNCSQCHGSDAHGSKGFPNLTDNDWLYGGTPEKILETLHKGRQGNMPVMAPALGKAEDARQVAHYVLSLSGSPHDGALAAAGQPKFAACAACHGAEGKGNPAVGAPNLTDKIWLHGAGEKAILAMINNGKQNVMPAQEGRLTEGQIHVLAAYVWGLSNLKSAAK